MTLSLMLIGIALAAQAESPDAARPSDPARASADTSVLPAKTILKGLYVGVGGGAAFENFDHDVGILPRVTVETTSGMFNLRAGYRASEILSAELLWEYYTGWDPKGPEPPLRGTQGWSLTGNVKAYATRSGLRPFAVIGLGVGRLEPDGRYTQCDPINFPPCHTWHGQTGFVARFGAGIDLPLTASWKVGVETTYVLTEADLANLDYITSGLELVYDFP
jgi:opacity protein-like surface antigen